MSVDCLVAASIFTDIIFYIPEFDQYCEHVAVLWIKSILSMYRLCLNEPVCAIIAKSQQGLAHKYLWELMYMYKPLSARSSRPLRYADRYDRHVCGSRSSLSQNRAFAVVVPVICNDTPPALRSVMLQGISPTSLGSLKTFHFTCLSR